MILSFIYVDGDNSVDPEQLDIHSRSMFEKLENDLRAVCSPLVCPKHGTDAKATFILNVGKNQYNWDLRDFCCSDFVDTIRSSLLPTTFLNVAWKGRQL